MPDVVLFIVLAIISLGMLALAGCLLARFLGGNSTPPVPRFKPGDGAQFLGTGESFVIAAVTHDRLYAGGWPCASFPREDCILTFSCSQVQSESMVQQCLGLPAGDPRRSIAQIFQGQADG